MSTRQCFNFAVGLPTGGVVTWSDPDPAPGGGGLTHPPTTHPPAIAAQVTLAARSLDVEQQETDCPQLSVYLTVSSDFPKICDSMIIIWSLQK